MVIFILNQSISSKTMYNYTKYFNFLSLINWEFIVTYDFHHIRIAILLQSVKIISLDFVG